MKNVDVEQVRTLVDRSRPGELTLLDVRQDWEYEEFHLPAARHIPLDQLDERLGELDKSVPVVAYCRAGPRSTAASSLLESNGFADVSNMVGGISAWNGAAAVGSADVGLFLFDDIEGTEQFFMVAYGMEELLRRFYMDSAARKGLDQDSRAMLRKLSGNEVTHEDVIYTLYRRNVSDPLERQAFHAIAVGSVADPDGEHPLEGGVEADELTPGASYGLGDLEDILDFAMMAEAQAMDLYTRFSRRDISDDLRPHVELLAREEKAHLKVVSKYKADVLGS